MPGVQALGLLLPGSGRLQVSLNVVDVEQARPRGRSWARPRGAAERGVEVGAGELVGLLPESAVAERERAGARRTSGRASSWSTAGSVGARGASRLAPVSEALLLTGDDLVIDDVWDVAIRRREAALGDSAVERMSRSRALLDELRGEHTYGVNTGFGRFVSESIPADQAEELQLRLLRSHACGVGEPYSDEVVRAAMLLRSNAIAKGYSGARVETVELLLDVLKERDRPVRPARGSVGASGDLAPLAHLALPLVGEGEAFVDGTRLPGAEALAAVGLAPVRLRRRKGSR